VGDAHAHPTLPEVLMEAAEVVFGYLIHIAGIQVNKHLNNLPGTSRAFLNVIRNTRLIKQADCFKINTGTYVCYMVR
jgi:hypothetical protein